MIDHQEISTTSGSVCEVPEPNRSPIVFISVQPHRESARVQELEKSKALSHAATIAHKRRKASKVQQEFRYCFRKHPDVFCEPERQNHASRTFPYSSYAAWLESETSDKADTSVCGPETSDLTLIDRQTQIFGSPQLDHGFVWAQALQDVPPQNMENVRRAADFFNSAIIPSHDLAVEIFDSYNIAPSFIPLLSQPLFYDAGIAMAASYQRSMRLPDVTTSYAILKHASRAIMKIRAHLRHSGWNESTKCTGLVVAIVCLALIEAVEGRSEIARQHLAGLRLVLDQLVTKNIRNNADPFNERTVAMLFETGHLMLGGDTIFGSERRQWNPVYPVRPFNDHISRLYASMSPGFQELMQMDQLSMDLIPVLARAATAENTVFQRQARADRRQETRRYTDFVDACPVLVAPDYEENLLEKLLTSAVLIYCNIIPNSFTSVPGYIVAARIQAMRIIGVYQPRSAIQRKALFWAAIVVTDGFRAREIVAPEATLSLECFLRDYPDLAAMEWRALENLLFNFLWSKTISRFWCEFWPKIVGNANMKGLRKSYDTAENGATIPIP